MQYKKNWIVSTTNSALLYYLSLRNNHILGALDIHPLHDLPMHNEIVTKSNKDVLYTFFKKQ